MKTGAIFDSTNAYRYTLWRQWDADLARVAFIMLNPSTADAQNDDATIRRCISFARQWGYGALEVVNLFAFRATHPRSLQQASDPIGAECDRYLSVAIAQADTVIVAWGNWGRLHQRDRAVLPLLQSHSTVECLGLNRSGQPKHPLYLAQTTPRIPYAGMVLGASIVE